MKLALTVSTCHLPLTKPLQNLVCAYKFNQKKNAPLMAILRSLRKLARNSNSGNLLLSLSHSSAPSPSQFSSAISHTPSFFSRSSSRFLPHLSKWTIPSNGGPLFLSFPPWKLSQSATPLYFQTDVLPKVPVFNLLRKQRIPVNLGLGSVATVRDSSESVVKDFNGGGGGFVESFVNWPNIISMSRLLSGPLLGWMIIHDMYVPAFIGLALSGATDWLDGYVARKMGINSVVGSYLDPLADKVLIGCVALAMVDKGLLYSELVGLIVLRDLALVGDAVYKRASDLDWKWVTWLDFFNLDGTHPQKVEPLYISKVNMVFQLVLVTEALLQPDFGTQETQSYITYLSWLVASTTVGSTAAYGVQYLKNRRILIQKTR